MINLVKAKTKQESGPSRQANALLLTIATIGCEFVRIIIDSTLAFFFSSSYWTGFLKST